MEKTNNKLKKILITGIIAIVPVAIVVAVVGSMITNLFIITKPIASKLEFGGIFTKFIVTIIITAIIVIILILLIGLFLNTVLGKFLKNWIDKNLFEHIPFYNTLTRITKQFAGIEKENYPVVEFDLYGNNTKIIGLLTDTLKDGRCVIYQPFSPIVNIGQIHIVEQDKLQKSSMSLKDAIDITSSMGLEAHKIYK